jgi:hypothetical protein
LSSTMVMPFALGFESRDRKWIITSQINTSYAGGGDVESITWSPEDGLNCTDCLEPLANPSETTIYTITITD